MVDDRLEVFLVEKHNEEDLAVYSVVMTEEPEVVENRHCAKCVGECKIY